MVQGVLLGVARKCSCGIISCRWPSWVIGALSKGWSIKIIIVKDCLWLGHHCKMLPHLNIVKYEEIEKCVRLGLEVDFWLSDVDPPRKLSLFESDQGSSIISRRRARHPPSKGWWYESFKLSHVECGGDMDGKWTFHVYTPGTSVGAVTQKVTLPGRDISSIFDSKVQGLSCPPPRIVNLAKPQIVKIRPNIFYHGGLFPLESTGPQFVTLCVFSPTGWVRRKLNKKEMCRLKDLPGDVLGSLSTKQVAGLCRDSSMVPIKVIIWLLDMMKNSDSKSPILEVAVEEEKGSKRNMAVEEEVVVEPDGDDR
jgi:hypothetical protein